MAEGQQSSLGGKVPFFSFTINSVGAAVAIVISIVSFIYTYLSSLSTGEHEAIKTVYTTYLDVSKTQLKAYA
jgi:hypothetical protein